MSTHSIEDMCNLLRSKNAFDDAYYLQANPDVAESEIDPLHHYVQFGSREGRRPTAYFDPGQYLRENPDVAEAGVEPFFHFVIQGILEGRRVPSAAETATATATATASEAEPPAAAMFDGAYYLAENEDVRTAGIDPERHYFDSGERERRRPNAFFDPRYYAQINPDVAASGMSLFRHFQEIGWKEGRRTTNPADPWRSFKSDRNILFIGHDAVQAGAQTVLLDIVRWFAEHTDLNVSVLLCDTGPLIGEYARYADVFVFQNYAVAIDDRIAHLINMKWELVYANTVRSGQVARHVTQALRHKAPLIAHLHERDAVLALYEDDLRALIASSDRFVVVDEHIAETLRSRHAVPKSIITVEPPFIRARLRGEADHEAAQAIRADVRRELGIAEDAMVVCGCGTAYERKGIDLFVDAAIADQAADPDSSTVFLWIGAGDDLEFSRQRAWHAEVGRRVVFTGHRWDASRLIGCADIFFLSSREDPFPLVCLEAAQYGIPILHFDAGTGIGAFVQAGDPEAAAGVAIPAFSPRAAADAIADLCADPERRAVLGARGRARLFAAYEAEAKLGRLYQILLALRVLKPSVTVIVPNYNHEPYLDARISSILGQSIKSIQVVILDDASTDGSAAVIGRYLADPRASFHPNDANSGSPFNQWMKGIALAEADVVWIAESDDGADPDFCRNLIGAFADPMVSIAAGRSLIVDTSGVVVPGALDPYYDSSEVDLYRGTWKRDGIAFIRNHFGAKCTLVSASGLLMRKARLAACIEGAGSLRIFGDWLVYLRMLKHDKIVFSESAVSYLRRYDQSTAHTVEGTGLYFRERAAIVDWVLDNANMSPIQLRRLLYELRLDWERFAWKSPGGALEDIVDGPAVLQRASHRHGVVALYVHGMLFSKGGIERLAAQLANALVIAGYEVVIYCAKGTSRKPVYPLFEQVRICGLSIEKSEGINRLADRLRRDKVTVFVPMLSEWLFGPAVEAGAKAGVAILVSEHNDPWKIEELWWSKAERVAAFANADRIHLLLPNLLDSLPEALRSRAVIIPNGVEIDNASAPVSDGTAKRIVCVARFAPQKRLDLLVEAFAIVARARPDWTLTLLGEGELKSTVERQVADLGLSHCIALPGTTDRVAEILAGSSLFVLPSEFEGFPIVILEAQRAGLPCIAFRACNGPNSLIAHEADGLLVDPFTAAALAEAMLALINDDDKRARFGQAARASVSRYALDTMLTQWIAVIDDVARSVA